MACHSFRDFTVNTGNLAFFAFLPYLLTLLGRVLLHLLHVIVVDGVLEGEHGEVVAVLLGERVIKAIEDVNGGVELVLDAQLLVDIVLNII